MNYFEFYKDYQTPTQNNIRPYSEMKGEVEADVLVEEISDEIEVRAIESTTNTIDFDHEHRQLLMAIKTKPFYIVSWYFRNGKVAIGKNGSV